MAAGDFYFAINATFRFFQDRYGQAALEAYWRALGKGYYRPLIERFRSEGLPSVESYWRDFFEKEPGGEVSVNRKDNVVEIDVRDCPAIRWLKDHGREIVPTYCEHCRQVSGAIAEEAGLAFELEGGGGSCRQTFFSKEAPS
jgi:hypothetical protein